MIAKWRQWLMNLAVLATGAGLGISYVVFLKEALSGERWSLLISLTLMTGGTLVVLIDFYLKVKHEEKIKLFYAQALIVLFFATVSVFFNGIRSLI